MSVKIKFGEESSNKIFNGISILNRAVSSSLGPMGHNVGIDEKYQKRIIHDGVTIAKAIQLEDKFEAFGADILTQSARKQVDEVGDGTTVVIILAHAIIEEARKLIATGINAMSLRRELEDSVKSIVSKIREFSIPVVSLDQKIQVATISAEDPILGDLVAKTLQSVGIDGIVTVEESKSLETYVEHQKGMIIDKGYASVYFVTDPTTMEATLEDSHILITDYELTNISDILPFLSKFIENYRLLTIIAPDYGGDVIPSFIKNKIEGRLLTLCTSVPLMGGKQKEMLEDIAILTGATMISKDTGRKLDSITIEDLGRAGRITATKDTTLIVDGKGNKEDIDKRIQSIKLQMKDTEGWDKEKLKERLAKLSNGVAVIRVGGTTEIEMLERKERVIDAVEATKAAIKSGIVPGGEIIYLQVKTNNIILQKALEAPFRKLMINAGFDPGQMLERIKGSKYGIDVLDGQMKDLLKSGIIDPTEVSIQALQNALSVAVQLLITDCLIVPDEMPSLSKK